MKPGNIGRLRSAIARITKKQVAIWAILGLHDGTVEVPNRDYYVYVRLKNGEVLEVYNQKVPKIAGMTVWIGYDRFSRKRLQILDYCDVYSDVPSFPFVIEHARSHTWPNIDTIAVSAEQFLPGLVAAAGAFVVRVYGSPVYSTGGWAHPDTVDVDLASHVPATGALWVLISLDSTGAVVVTDGSGADTLLELELGDIPAVPTGNLPLAAVQLYDGQAEIIQTKYTNNVINLRWGGYSTLSGSATTFDLAAAIHAADPKTTPVDADETALSDSEASFALKKLTWANIKATLKTYTDTLYAAAAAGVTNGDSHDHAGGDGAQIDHGGLAGLADDDHTQYIKHSLATAADDFLVASGAGAVVKKTLAETKTILGIGGSSGGGGGAIYGDGSDGSAVLDGANTFPWASLSGSTYTLLRNVYLNNLTVDSGIELIGPYQIFGIGTLTNSGAIHNDGYDAVANVAGAGGLAGFYLAGGVGGAGIASGAAAGTGTAGPAAAANTLVGNFAGRGAGAWANAITQSALAGGTLSTSYPTLANGGWRIVRNIVNAILKYVPASTPFQVAPSIGGGGGAKSATGTACNSGGGGGGGGALLIAFKTIINNALARISCDGGDGGDAGGTNANAGGGGGGSGGLLWLVYDTLTNNGTISSAGGLGGSSVALGSTPLRAVCVPLYAGSYSGTALTFPANALGRTPSTESMYIITTHQPTAAGGLNTPTVTGWGLTWNLVEVLDFNSIASPVRRLCVFYAYGTPDLSQDNETLVAQFAASTVNVTGTVYQIENTTGNVVQSKSNRTDSATSLTVTLDNPCGSTDALVFAAFAFSAGSARVVGAGFTQVFNVTSGAQMTTEASYNDTTADISWTTNAAAGGIAIEVEAVASMENGQPGYAGQVIQFQN